MHDSSVDTKCGGDIPNRSSTGIKLDGSGSIKHHPFTAKDLAVSPSIPHTGPYSISYNISFQPAIAPMIVNMALPIGVEVSRAFW